MPPHINNAQRANQKMVAETILSALDQHVLLNPNKTVFTFLQNGKISQTITTKDLAFRSKQLACKLLTITKPSERALLLYTPSLAFIEAFVACLYAGIIAVPAYAPRKNRNADRILSIAKDCSPALILCQEAAQQPIINNIISSLPNVKLLTTDNLEFDQHCNFKNTPISPSKIAFLQYTSGSTAQPKGIEITHQNIIANQKIITKGGDHDMNTVMVGWLPLFHDMGLICYVLQPIFLGIHSVIMPPVDFLRKPIRWLQAISKYGGTTAGGPNFSYELLADKITEEEKKSLNLKSWKVAFNGAEPVRFETLQKFSKAFASCGFEPEVSFPCYGLAEATLFVSGGSMNESPKVQILDQKAIESNLIRTTNIIKQQQSYVSCGLIDPSYEVAIVHPENSNRCKSDQIGEIWLRGDSIANGYWNQPEKSALSFNAMITNENENWLRTGDLGFVKDNELYITGRLKDLIIIRGRNIYPQDIEAIVEKHLSFVVPNTSGAFISNHNGNIGVNLLIEGTRELVTHLRRKNTLGSQVWLDNLKVNITALRKDIMTNFNLSLFKVGFVRPTNFPRTSSGKVQRFICKQILENKPQEIILSDNFNQKTINTMRNTSRIQKNSAKDELLSLLEGVLEKQIFQKIKNGDLKDLQLDALGIDSMSRASLAGEIEDMFDQKIDAEWFESQSIEQLIDFVENVHSSSNTTDLNPQKTVQHSQEKNNIDSRYLSLSDFIQKESSDIFAKTINHQAWEKDLNQRGHKKYLLPVKAYSGGKAIVDDSGTDKEVTFFCSADYLGLANDPAVKSAAAASILQYGTNVAAVPVIAGTTPIHKELEKTLAEWLGQEDCVLFPTGHSANVGTVASLCAEKDYVIVDNQVHYSLLEGIRLAGSKWRTFLHNDKDSLEKVLQNVRKLNPERGILVIAEGVYGIGGELADIPELVKVCRKYDARIMIDDAHGIGSLGPNGSGVTRHVNPALRPDIVMGSLSKSLGSFGGFICASKSVVNYLRYYAKAISFAVGMPIVNVAACLEAIKIIKKDPSRYLNLQEKATWFRSLLLEKGLKGCEVSQSQIMSVFIGDELRMKNITKDAFNAGVWAEGLPFPAVSRGNEMLRFRVRHDHTKEELQEAAAIIAQAIEANPPTSITLQDSNYPNQLTPEEVQEVIELMMRSARQHDQGLPWVSKTYIQKYLERSDFWATEAADSQWQFIRNDSGRLVGAFRDDQRQVNGTGEAPTRLLGSFVWEKDYFQEFAKKLTNYIKTLDAKAQIIAPASYPVQIFGSGIQDWKNLPDLPLFETSLDSKLTNILGEIESLKAKNSKEYFLVKIQHDSSNQTQELDNDYHHIRTINRANLFEEANQIIPLLNRTIGQLPLCTPLEPSLLLGLINELRDLILSDIWLLLDQTTSDSSETIGCAMCYPNVSEEFKRICGAANVVDYESIRQSMESTKTAFLAWFALEETSKKEDLTTALIDRLKHQLIRRGFTHVWVSWEAVTPNLTPHQIAAQLGKITAHVEMPFYSRFPLRG